MPSAFLSPQEYRDFAAQCLRWAARAKQREPDGVAVVLVIRLSLYCAVAALFALVVYYLMQPTRFPNPGMAAHKSSPVTVSYVEVLRSEREGAQRAIKFEPEPETIGATTGEIPDAKPQAKKPKNTSQSRTHPVRRQQQPRPVRRQQQQPPDTTHYAQQLFFSGYRPMY
jgi:hypothetical protein